MKTLVPTGARAEERRSPDRHRPPKAGESANRIRSRLPMTTLKVRRLLLAGSVGGLLSAACSPSGPAADAIYRNANVVTADDDFSTAEAFAVVDGRFAAVGTEEEVEAAFPGGAAELVDFQGKTVLPGFNDNHIHLGPGRALQRWEDGLVPGLPAWSAEATEPDELFAALEAEAATKPPGEWILGGLTRMDWPNNRIPDRWLLDEAAPDNPVMLTRGPHTYLLNSPALALARIDRNTPDPEGGWIFRDDSGEPTGRVLESARRIVDRVLPPRAEIPYEAGIETMRASLGKLAAMGITSVNIAGIRPPGIPAVRDLYSRYREELPRATMQVRLSPGHDTYDHGEEGIRKEIEALEALGFVTGEGDSRFRIGAIKMSIDGGLSAPVFWSLEPYEGRPDFFGAIRIPADVFYPVARRAHELGWQLGIHAMGDGAVKMVADQMARILEEIPREDHRHYMHHVAVKPPEDTMRLMAEHGIMVASQPSFTVGLGAYAEEALPAGREETQNPTRSLLDAGVRVSHGSDSAPYGPLITIWTAVTRRGFDGAVHGPEEAVSIEEAIRLHTREPAFFSFEESEKGAIAEGMLADFVVLSDDILSVPSDTIRDLRVERTFIGGREIPR